MENLFYPVTVDILEKHLPPIVDVKQGDNARGVAITLTAAGGPYAIPTGGNYMLRVRKPDKTISVLKAENKGNILYAELTEQTLAAAGQAIAEAAIYGADGKIISSFIFILQITEAACISDKITSSDEFDGLAQLLKEITAAQHTTHFEIYIPANRWNNKAAILNKSDNELFNAIKSTSSVQVIFDDDSAATVVNCGVAATEVGDGTITLTCATTPTSAVSATIIIMN